MLNTQCFFSFVQKEGEALSRRNGELEATVRKLRAAARDVNAERERLAARIHTLESQVRLNADDRKRQRV